MQFVVIARDAKDDGALERRLKHREEHLKVGKKASDRGERILGGPLLNDNGEMCGSIIVSNFPSRKELEAWIESDPYTTGNVWEDIEVIPCIAKLAEDR